MNEAFAEKQVSERATTAPAESMLWILGGAFVMGSDGHYPEEAPAHKVVVGGFWMDRTTVTNSQFERFVTETGYVTLAERPATRGGLDGAEFVWGDELTPGGVHMANTWQGEFPYRNRCEDGYEWTAGGFFPAQWLRARGHGRQCLAVDKRLVPGSPADRQPLLHCRQPRRREPRGQLRSAHAGHQDSAEGDQGRLISMRAELLSPLSTGRAHGATGGHLDLPSRFQVHRPTWLRRDGAATGH
jgi:hypothetical protein